MGPDVLKEVSIGQLVLVEKEGVSLEGRRSYATQCPGGMVLSQVAWRVVWL